MLKKRDWCLCTVVALLLAAASAASAQVKVRTIDYEGWSDCYELTNPLARLVIVPQIGGRIMEYSIGGKNVMWLNEGELGKTSGDDIGKKWRNYGGYKAWNAPESKWQEPYIDYFYDSMPAKVEVLTNGSGVRVTTSPLLHRGLQFVRDIILSDNTSRVRLVERMKNVSDVEIEWSIWDVTQVKVPCWIVFPINPDSVFGRGWHVLHPKGGEIKQVRVFNDIGIMRYDNRVENWETDARGGWMAYLNNDLAYTKRWAVRLVGVTYPDGGCDSAFYSCKTDYAGGYSEMEVLGPLVKLKPGEETELVEDWFLSELEESADDVPAVMARMRSLQDRGMLPRGVQFK